MRGSFFRQRMDICAHQREAEREGRKHPPLGNGHTLIPSPPSLYSFKTWGTHADVPYVFSKAPGLGPEPGVGVCRDPAALTTKLQNRPRFFCFLIFQNFKISSMCKRVMGKGHSQQDIHAATQSSQPRSLVCMCMRAWCV